MKKIVIAGLIGLIGSAHAAIIDSGSGSISVDALTTNSSAKAAQGGVIAGWDTGVDAGAELSLTGSMTLSEVSSFGDKVWFVLGRSTDFVPTNPDNYGSVAFGSKISVSDSVSAPFAIVENTVTVENSTTGVSNTDRSVDFALNLTLAANFEVSKPQTHIYEFGLDFDNDGTYDYTRSGTFDINGGNQNNRIRFGFGVVQAERSEAAQLSNAWEWTLTDEHVAIPEPGTLGLMSAFGGAILFARRKLKK